MKTGRKVLYYKSNINSVRGWFIRQEVPRLERVLQLELISNPLHRLTSRRQGSIKLKYLNQCKGFFTLPIVLQWLKEKKYIFHPVIFGVYVCIVMVVEKSFYLSILESYFHILSVHISELISF